MARIGLRLLVVLSTALAGCVSPPYRVDASSDAGRADPILVAPGTRGGFGGPVWIPLPEFTLDSGRTLTLNLSVPGSATVTVTLEVNVGGLEAHLPMGGYEALASTSQPEEVIHAALSGSSGRVRFLKGDQALAAQALAVTLAQRLPRRTSNSWKDLFAHDSKLRSLTLVPGMRLRLEGMLPVTADLLRESPERSQGSIISPSYLYTSPAGDMTSTSITLSPALRKLEVNASSECNHDCERWRDAGGLSALIAAQWRYWTLLYPERLGFVQGHTGDLQFVHEELRPQEGPPAVLLVATSTGGDMAVFLAKARERLEDALRSASLQAATTKWREAQRALDNAARAAGLTPEAVFRLASRASEVRSPEEIAALMKLKEERAAYGSFRSEGANFAIDCKLDVASVAGCFVLRYRVLPVPEILVTVQGVQRWVELGTTVGMVLAPLEPVRATRTLADKYDSKIEEWRNAASRILTGRIGVYRNYEGSRHAMEVQPGSPPDAIRNVVLQPGDEIRWSN